VKVLVAITGASGFPLAVKFLKQLGKHGVERHLVVSENAEKVMEYEGGKRDLKKLCEHFYSPTDTHTSICSGSYPMHAMVVIPCSMNTLAHVANGIEHNSITRAAGVNLKQERRVVLVPRETPLSLPALENMVKARKAGCSIVPPMLCYYVKPDSLGDVEDYVIGKVLELLGIKHELYKSWEEGG
jgi:4-hydroxy-3-polyprenylbenzoate decarboxylase